MAYNKFDKELINGVIDQITKDILDSFSRSNLKYTAGRAMDAGRIPEEVAEDVKNYMSAKYTSDVNTKLALKGEQMTSDEVIEDLREAIILALDK